MSLSEIQSSIKVPKKRLNKFGGYKYRNCEDILEALNPYLKKFNAIVITTYTILNIGDRHYIKATVTYKSKDGEETSVDGLARESQIKKKMDDSQLTGTASSYARKYALEGLLAISDTRDADEVNDIQDTLDTGLCDNVNGTVNVETNYKYPNPPEVKSDSKLCLKCGAKMVINPKTGKYFCSDKCFVK